VGHANARTTVYARRVMVERREQGWRAPQIAEQFGVSAATVHKWWRRWDEEGPSGLLDRPSRPHTSPNRTPDDVEAQIVAVRVASRRGAVFIAGELGLVASTVGRVLARRGVPGLAAIDAITGLPVRRRHTGIRYERPRCGDLLHIDVKKLGRVPDGGGWRVHGRSEQVKGRGIGYDYLHVAVDDHSRLAYIEVHPDEKEATCALFLHRAATWFHDQHKVRVLRVLTDNALAYRRGSTWAAVCVALGIRRRFTKPGCPWTNGKAERLNRTLLTEYAYARAWTSNAERVAALDGWVRHYNTERAHSALGGHPPITRLAA
jgi:transposase InsO family protein